MNCADPNDVANNIISRYNIISVDSGPSTSVQSVSQSASKRVSDWMESAKTIPRRICRSHVGSHYPKTCYSHLLPVFVYCVQKSIQGLAACLLLPPIPHQLLRNDLIMDGNGGQNKILQYHHRQKKNYSPIV